MIAMLLSAGVAFFVTILATPVAIRFFRKQGVGQFIQDEVDHAHKQGTPTMGGLVMIVAVVLGWLAGHLDAHTPEGDLSLNFKPFLTPGLLVLLAFVGMGLIGFLDDLAKVTKARNLGLRKRWKFAGQLAISALFAWGAVGYDVTTEIAFTRPLGIDLGWLYVLWVLLLLTATSNAVNITDGFRRARLRLRGPGVRRIHDHLVLAIPAPEFYAVVGTLELAVLSAGLVGATLGFLWWNAAPAKIIMGDTGSQALGERWRRWPCFPTPTCCSWSSAVSTSSKRFR